MLRTPRPNEIEKALTAEIVFANGALFAPSKPGTYFEENRDKLVMNSALESLYVKMRASEDVRDETVQELKS